MIYQGSKNGIAKYIVPIIQKYIEDNHIDTYIELFVGGANIIDKVKCKNRIGYDINDNLITLLKYIQSDITISIAPNICEFEHYKDVRANQYTGKYSREYVSLIGYSASYGGRYFDGGYGRDRTGKRNIYYERITHLREQAPNLEGIELGVHDYRDLNVEDYKNCIFYLDPPYKGTKQYAKQSIDYEEFYEFCRKLSKANIVFISEYNMPDDFECIWQKEKKVYQKSDRVMADVRTEKLYRIGNIQNESA